jgi:ABC-type sugar transport system permease subunit
VFVTVISTIGGLQLFIELQVLFNRARRTGRRRAHDRAAAVPVPGSTLGSAALPGLGYGTAISIITFVILLVVSIAQGVASDALSQRSDPDERTGVRA